MNEIFLWLQIHKVTHSIVKQCKGLDRPHRPVARSAVDPKVNDRVRLVDIAIVIIVCLMAIATGFAIGWLFVDRHARVQATQDILQLTRGIQEVHNQLTLTVASMQDQLNSHEFKLTGMSQKKGTIWPSSQSQ